MPIERFGTTLVQHILHAEKLHPAATGDFSNLLNEIAVASKVISREVNRAGLLKEILGRTGTTNVQGEEVQKLDDYANQTFLQIVGRSGAVGLLASEEEESTVPGTPGGRYAVLFDPLDGSGNIDISAPIGTIFSILRIPADRPGLGDLLRPGSEQVAAGYVIYGSSTILVYTAGNGVHGFTLDPSVGEFLLSHPDLKMPARGTTYSINEGNQCRWSEHQRRYVEHLKQEHKPSGRPYGQRYIGALIADFHRTLLRGGIFMYPADSKSPSGKLRYLYEAAPIGMIAVQAGGAASDGTRPILDKSPTALHERTPLFVGSRDDVAEAVAFLSGTK